MIVVKVEVCIDRARRLRILNGSLVNACWTRDRLTWLSHENMTRETSLGVGWLLFRFPDRLAPLDERRRPFACILSVRHRFRDCLLP